MMEYLDERFPASSVAAVYTVARAKHPAGLCSRVQRDWWWPGGPRSPNPRRLRLL